MIEMGYTFRGKRLDDGRWVVGYYCGPTGAQRVDGHWITDVFDTFAGAHRISPATLCPCTGLRDADGKWIFTGDILRRDEDILGRDEVILIARRGACVGVQNEWIFTGDVFKRSNVHRQRGYMGYYFDVLPDRGYRTDPLYWLNGGECRIVGNIYDNPELLEVGT